MRIEILKENQLRKLREADRTDTCILKYKSSYGLDNKYIENFNFIDRSNTWHVHLK